MASRVRRGQRARGRGRPAWCRHGTGPCSGRSLCRRGRGPSVAGGGDAPGGLVGTRAEVPGPSRVGVCLGLETGAAHPSSCSRPVPGRRLGGPTGHLHLPGLGGGLGQVAPPSRLAPVYPEGLRSAPQSLWFRSPRPGAGGGRREREPRPAHCVPIVALHKGAASLSLSFFTYAAELKVTEKVK